MVALRMFFVWRVAAVLTYPVHCRLWCRAVPVDSGRRCRIWILGAGSLCFRGTVPSVGLTTAASIWATAAIGLTVGFGR